MKRIILAGLVFLGGFTPFSSHSATPPDTTDLWLPWVSHWNRDEIKDDQLFGVLKVSGVKPDADTLQLLARMLTTNGITGDKYQKLLAYLFTAAAPQPAAGGNGAPPPEKPAPVAEKKAGAGAAPPEKPADVAGAEKGGAAAPPPTDGKKKEKAAEGDNKDGKADADQTKPKSKYYLQKNPENSSKWRVNFSSGAEFMNPYFISVPSGAAFGTLTNSGNSTVAYLQFDVLRRWVLAPDYLVGGTAGDGFTFSKNFDKDMRLDFQFDIGFLLGNSSKITNNSYSAQTLAGSDIYAQLGATLPIWRNHWALKDSIEFPVQLGLGGSIGITTERSFEKVHANEFIGGVVDIGIPHGFFENTNSIMSGLCEFRGGYGHIDFPDTTGTANQVNLDGNGIPRFNERWVPEVGVNVLVPVGKLYLNAEINAYFNDETPDQWNVKVGATLPWSTIKSTFSGMGF